MNPFGVRHGQMCLLFTAFIVNYALRSNLSVAIVAMTDSNSQRAVNLTISQKGLLLGFVGYGCLFSSIPSGILTNRVGARYSLGLATLGSSLVTIALPIASTHLGYAGASVSRALLGIFQGSLYPSINHHIAQWSPLEERGLFIAIVYNGISLGMMLMESTAGFIASGFGWPSIFYLSGACSAVWSLVWLVLARDSPDDHETISLEEKQFIEKDSSKNANSCQKLSVPWREIAVSLPFWSLLIAQFGFVYGKTLQDSLLPTYLKEIYHFNIKQSGLLSSIPPAATVLSSALVALIGKFSQKFCLILPLTCQRKLWTSLALYGAALVLLTISQTRLGAAATVACLTLAKCLVAFNHLGMMCGDVDLSPNFTGVLNGMATGLGGNLGALLAPVFAGWMLHDEANPSDWSRVFLSGAIVETVANTVYLIFGSARIQPWNEPQTKGSS